MPPQDTTAEETTDTDHVDEDTEAIMDAFWQKYPEADMVGITIEAKTDTHARGMVELGEGPGNSGGFLAAKVDGAWVIVFDGNGSYECDLLEEYGFPESMKKGCPIGQ